MSTVDFFVAVLMLLSILLAVLRGFTREVLTILAFIGAVAAVFYGLPVAKPLFRHMFEDQTTADVAAGAALGLVTLIVLSVLSHYIAKSVSKAGLGMADRVLGAVFGIARAFLVLCLLYIGLQWAYGDHLPDWATEAKATPFVAKGAEKLVAALPKNIQDEIKPDSGKDKKAKADTREGVNKAVDKAEDAKDAAKEKAEDAKDTVKTPPQPPEKPEEQPTDEGYNKTDRNSLDSLIKKDGNEVK